jgi:hypothetical protein
VWHLLADALSPNPWAQLGIASIVCALLFAISWTLWRQHLADEETKSQLFRDRIEREQFLSDRLAPLLADAVEILGTAPARFETALTQAQKATQASDLERLIIKLQDTLRDIGK